MNAPSPLMISGHDVLGEILRRERARRMRERMRRAARALRRKETHTARLAPNETVESNLPLP